MRDLFAGPGEVRALARALDWSTTPLGPTRAWPESLRNAVRMVMDAPFPINIWCGDDLVLIYNDAYTQVLGTKHPDALGRSGKEVWAEIWPDISWMFDRIRDGGEPVYAQDSAFAVAREPEPIGGEEPNAWFTFSLSPIREPDGEISGYLNIVWDATARILAERDKEAALDRAERAESTIREIFEQAPAFLALLAGDDYVFEYVNEAYYQLVGHRPLIGRRAFEALPELAGQGFKELLDRVIETREPFIGREIPVMVTRAAGAAPERRFVDLVYHPMMDHSGAATGIVAHGFDVTDHVLARRDAQRARAEAERANQAKNHFLANMSHEIRTPINAVIGYTDLLTVGIAGELNPQQAAYLERIKLSSEHLLALVNDILDLAKIEAGEMNVGRGECDISVPIAQATQMIGPEAEQRGLTIHKKDCGPDLRVLGDERRIRQVLLNLLSNAVKFTESGGAITVSCRQEQNPSGQDTILPVGGPWNVISVADTGQGIAEDQLERIFEPFIQAEEGHTRSTAGTGLGLAISRRLARLMGGDLTVRSRLGEGSTFEVWLPAVGNTLVVPGGGVWSGLARPSYGDIKTVRGLGAVYDALVDGIEIIEDEFVRRLSDDFSTSTGTTDPIQLANHTAPLLTIIAKGLNAIEAGADSGLLSDGQEFQEVLALGHGRQRRRLGWTRADLDAEYEILHEVVHLYLRKRLESATEVDTDTALALVHQLIEDARAASIAAFEAAAS